MNTTKRDYTLGEPVNHPRGMVETAKLLRDTRLLCQAFLVLWAREGKPGDELDLRRGEIGSVKGVESLDEGAGGGGNVPINDRWRSV